MLRVHCTLSSFVIVALRAKSNYNVLLRVKTKFRCLLSKGISSRKRKRANCDKSSGEHSSNDESLKFSPFERNST